MGGVEGARVGAEDGTGGIGAAPVGGVEQKDELDGRRRHEREIAGNAVDCEDEVAGLEAGDWLARPGCVNIVSR